MSTPKAKGGFSPSGMLSFHQPINGATKQNLKHLNPNHFYPLKIIFFKNSPKIACQVPKPLKPLASNNIHHEI